jgi:multiple sugar transport system substrate-binding protein
MGGALLLAVLAVGPPELVFKYQPLGSDPAPFERLLRQFQSKHLEVYLRAELLPNDSDLAHQYFLTALEGRAKGLDVFVVDVVWVAELAKAGWIADLTASFPPAQLREELLPGPVEAVVLSGHTFAVPWFMDVGLLYYRTDLVSQPPATYEAVTRDVGEVRARHPEVDGFLWQARQSEALVCNVVEAIWGHGGETLADGRLALDTPAAARALEQLRRFVQQGVSPKAVLSSSEDDSRRAFVQGKALFMRNWPYAWDEAERQDSPIRGKVGVAPLPTLSGEPGAGALGGWQLALNAHAPVATRSAAVALIRFLTSPAAERVLAVSYGRNPPREALYSDPELAKDAPHLPVLLPLLRRARPRPVTPYYSLLSDTLQSDFSAAVSGVLPVGTAMRRAQRRADFLMGMTPP